MQAPAPLAVEPAPKGGGLDPRARDDLISDESWLTTLAMIGFMEETPRIDAPIIEDAIWLAWSNALGQSVLNREQLLPLEAFWIE